MLNLVLFAAATAATPVPSTPASRTIAPAAEVAVPLSYRRSVTARNGSRYDLTVFLPRHYDPASGRRYPVFYFVPGGTFGIHLSQVARYLASGDMPDLIVVGVDFGDEGDYFRDLPTAGPDPHWNVAPDRGAANFLRVLTREIKPAVDREFPTDPADTGIGGHSLGGFFALYALFNAPGVFGHVYASSPSVDWQDFALLREEARAAKAIRDLPARVFVDQGDLERDDGRLEALTQAVTARSYPSLRWRFVRAPGQTHQTVAFADGIDALYAIYGPTLRRPEEEELAAVAGTYRASDGRTFRLQREDGRLFLVGFDGAPGRIELLSDKPGSWFVRYLWTRLSIDRADASGAALTIRLVPTPGPNGEAKTPVFTATRVSAATLDAVPSR